MQLPLELSKQQWCKTFVEIVPVNRKGTSQQVSIQVSKCQYMSASVNTSQQVSIQVSKCQYMSASVNTCQHVVNLPALRRIWQHRNLLLSHCNLYQLKCLMSLDLRRNARTFRTS